tara:strand:+ start:768 stop:1859 length:1092 start_codon:yes stop_codon:yes gene_type:complete
MNICLIGNNLTSLSLAKALTNKKIKVFMYYFDSRPLKLETRTIGISRENLNFFNSHVINLPKRLYWNINNIKILNEKDTCEKILDFKEKNKTLFSIIKYKTIFKTLEESLKKNKFFKKKLIDENKLKVLIKKKFDLYINCDKSNYIHKELFNKKFKKNYKSFAYTTILSHRSKKPNNQAIQIFTKYGPIAFLPISNKKTSLVFSVYNKDFHKKIIDINELIKTYNKFYFVTSQKKIISFPLHSLLQKNYYLNNVLSFGDCIHTIHPLAGQGFNMTLRDMKILLNIIENKISLGLELDNSIFEDFEQKTKHYNYLFSNSIDFIYEFFKFDKKFKTKFTNKIFHFFNEKNNVKKLIIKSADIGLF